jgi:two-component system, LuxR family, sensor kinase FixL
MPKFNPLWWPKPPVILSYGVAVLSVTAALLMAWWIESVWQSVPPVSLFLCAVMFSAWFGGTGPGLLAIVFSVLAFNYYFLPPIYSLSLTKELPRLVFFALSGVFVVSLTAAQRRAAESLRDARDDLHRTVQELKRINEALQAENAERKRAEDALRRSEAYLAEAQKLSQTGSWACTAERLETTYFSTEMFRMMGLPAGENPPSTERIGKYFAPEAWARIMELFETARREKVTCDGEFPMVLPDGSNRVIRILGHPVLNAAGDIVEFVGTTIDITEQRQARAALEKALAEIKKSEDKLQIIIDTIPTLAWCTLPDGSAEFLNQRWLEYTGLCVEEARNWGWTVVRHVEDSTHLMDKWRASVATGEPFEAEARFRRADGTYRWCLARAVPLRDELGNIIRWYGTNTDIEDRKQAEEIRTAQARQAGLRADVTAALSKPADSVGILGGSAEAIVRHLDAAFARIWTLNKEKNMLELQASAGMYTHLDGPHSRIQVGKLKIGLIAEEKKPHLTNDVVNDPRVSDKAWARNEGIVSFAGYPLIVQDRVVGVMAMFARQRLSAATLDTLAWVADSIAHGIERKRAEEGLREQARLLDLTHDTVFVRDMNDIITYWNRGAEELYGWTKEEAVGKVSHQLMQTIFAVPLEEVTTKLLRTGRWEGELVHTKRDGTQVIVASRWSMHQDERGRPVATLETNNDITERKRAEEALHKAQAELAHVTRVTTLGEMTASIAHELNQPLAAVVNNASACMRWLAANNIEEARQSAALIIADGHRAGEIISGIRALINKAPPQRDWLDINETIIEVIALARSEVQKNRVSLQTRLSSDIPLILGDRIQLQQVILNLINNAIEAMSGVNDGPRELQVGSAKDQSQGVRVAVRDSGPGLDPESLNHIFTAFYTTKPQGMGMGLAISRSIVEAHGGRLWATANHDRGATFQFTVQAGGEG